MDVLERCNAANEHLQEMMRLEQAARAELETAKIAFRLLEVRELLAGVPGSNEAARRAFIENEHEGFSKQQCNAGCSGENNSNQGNEEEQEDAEVEIGRAHV